MKILLKSIFAFIFFILPSFSHDPLMNTPLFKGNPFQSALFSLNNEHEDIKTFYEKKQNKPVWFFQGNLTKCGQIALETLQNAGEQGLNPHDYEDAMQAANHPENWIKAELILTKHLLEFIHHLYVGRIDPRHISRDIKFQSISIHPVDILLEAIQDPTAMKIRHMGPTFPQYAKLKATLDQYRNLAKQTKEWPTIKNSKPLKLGDKNPEVKTLRQILNLYGDLKNSENHSSIFDKEVDVALRQFQQRYMLDANGVVDQKTKDALNQPIEKLIRKIIINMERLRWLPNDLGDKYIIVNVAGYQVQAYERAALQLTIPAIVGRPSRRTPLFYATLKNVVVNPSWGVPYNILVHDKLPKIINDPSYVRRAGFTVTDNNGNIVDPDQADWENEGRSYHLRQSPGQHNALGRIKFNIENPYTIYLHGTPDEKLFQKTKRAFSSGCIRLKNPTVLAAWVLNNSNKWSAENIENSIQKGATQILNPADKMSVFFTYQTVWVANDGLIHISDDPYKMDAKMEKVLSPSA